MLTQLQLDYLHQLTLETLDLYLDAVDNCDHNMQDHYMEQLDNILNELHGQRNNYLDILIGKLDV